MNLPSPEDLLKFLVFAFGGWGFEVAAFLIRIRSPSHKLETAP